MLELAARNAATNLRAHELRALSFRCVCVYVCVCVFVCANSLSLSSFSHLFTHTRSWVSICICMCARTHKHTQLLTHIYTRTLNASRTYLPTNSPLSRLYNYVYIYIYESTYPRSGHVYIYIYIRNFSPTNSALFYATTNSE